MPGDGTSLQGKNQEEDAHHQARQLAQEEHEDHDPQNSAEMR